MSTREKIIELAEISGESILLLEPPYFDDAIIGVLECTSQVVYDRSEVIRIIARKGYGSLEDAEEFFYYNVVDSQSIGYPVFVDTRIAE